MTDSVEEAIHTAWSSILAGVLDPARVHTGSAPDDTPLPNASLLVGMTAINEETATGERIEQHQLTITIRAERLPQARSIARAAARALAAAPLDLAGWIDTWQGDRMTTHEGDGLWSVAVTLDIQQQVN